MHLALSVRAALQVSSSSFPRPTPTRAPTHTHTPVLHPGSLSRKLIWILLGFLVPCSGVALVAPCLGWTPHPVTSVSTASQARSLFPTSLSTRHPSLRPGRLMTPTSCVSCAHLPSFLHVCVSLLLCSKSSVRGHWPSREVEVTLAGWVDVSCRAGI
jgi:hypothetical protein